MLEPVFRKQNWQKLQQFLSGLRIQFAFAETAQYSDSRELNAKSGIDRIIARGEEGTRSSLLEAWWSLSHLGGELASIRSPGGSLVEKIVRSRSK